MTTRVVAMRIGDVELLVETAAVSAGGSQQTSVLGDAADKVVDAYERAERAIVAVATSVAGTVVELSRQAACPRRLEVEIGLKFSVQGDVIVASASGEASLRVLVSYEPAQRLG